MTSDKKVQYGNLAADTYLILLGLKASFSFQLLTSDG